MLPCSAVVSACSHGEDVGKGRRSYLQVFQHGSCIVLGLCFVGLLIVSRCCVLCSFSLCVRDRLLMGLICWASYLDHLWAWAGHPNYPVDDDHEASKPQPRTQKTLIDSLFCNCCNSSPPPAFRRPAVVRLWYSLVYFQWRVTAMPP
ncbi:hypothetical protein DsansV1_C07g0077301 [Dioscorea sansibarensis]